MGSLHALKADLNRLVYKYVLLNENGILFYEYLYCSHGSGSDIHNRYLTINDAVRKNCKLFICLYSKLELDSGVWI